MSYSLLLRATPIFAAGIIILGFALPKRALGDSLPNGVETPGFDAVKDRNDNDQDQTRYRQLEDLRRTRHVEVAAISGLNSCRNDGHGLEVFQQAPAGCIIFPTAFTSPQVVMHSAGHQTMPRSDTLFQRNA